MLSLVFLTPNNCTSLFISSKCLIVLVTIMFHVTPLLKTTTTTEKKTTKLKHEAYSKDSMQYNYICKVSEMNIGNSIFCNIEFSELK